MPPAVMTLLTVLLVLEVKHFIFDYPLQTRYQLQNKSIYGHPGGLLHAGLHVLGTSAAFLVVRPSLAVGTAILVGEYVVHYHLDWGKEQIIKRGGYTAAQAIYWWGIGTDQMLHHLTYLIIAGVLVATST